MDSNLKIALLVVIAIAAVVVMWFELRAIQRKKLESLKKQKFSTTREDAHNAVVTTRNLIRVFSGRGVNTAKAESILMMAQQHLNDRDFSGAKRFAGMARNALMEAKEEHEEAQQTDPAEEEKTATAPGPKVEISGDYEVNVPEETDDSASLTYTGTKLLTEKFPPNYLEARFTMTSAEEMIVEAEERGDDMGLARHFLGRARVHFDAGRLSDSLACAVKSRKAVEGREILVSRSEMEEIEAIFDRELISMVKVREKSAEQEASETAEKEEEEGAPVETSSETALKCPKCGHPVEEGDRFCPGCGAKIAVTHYCPQCGFEARAGDRFCRNCGARL